MARGVAIDVAHTLRPIAVEELAAQGFEPEIDAAALAEAAAIAEPRAGDTFRAGDQAQPAADDAGPRVEDQRDRPWFSIDNADTRDLDQLSCAEDLPDGRTRLAVAIAEVDAFVAPGSAMDRRAAVNTTSVYTAAGVFPMLPPRLSEQLSSLHEGQDRLALVVGFSVDADGAVGDETVVRAWVHNHARFAYGELAAWMHDASAAPPALVRRPSIAGQLRLHQAATERLRRWRHQRGAVEVAGAQARPVFDAEGRLVDLQASEPDAARALIGELMIATNGALLRWLERRGMPTLRRVLDTPRRWDRLVQLAAAHGHALPPEPDAAALDLFVAARRAADPAGFERLSLAVIKLLGSGGYAAAPAGAAPNGHFGLALPGYTHATAPNRRLPDLLMQRLAKAALAGRAAPYTLAELAALAERCTQQEDRAATVERRVLKAAAALLLHGREGEVFDAVVTGRATKGTFVRIASPLVEGRVVRGEAGLDVGDALRVRLLAVDLAQRHLDFEPA
jgi:exoribonuclease-2